MVRFVAAILWSTPYLLAIHVPADLAGKCPSGGSGKHRRDRKLTAKRQPRPPPRLVGVIRCRIRDRRDHRANQDGSGDCRRRAFRSSGSPLQRLHEPAPPSESCMRCLPSRFPTAGRRLQRHRGRYSAAGPRVESATDAFLTEEYGARSPRSQSGRRGHRLRPPMLFRKTGGSAFPTAACGSPQAASAFRGSARGGFSLGRPPGASVA
jgi:hypothetical protein